MTENIGCDLPSSGVLVVGDGTVGQDGKSSANGNDLETRVPASELSPHTGRICSPVNGRIGTSACSWVWCNNRNASMQASTAL